MNPKVRDVSAKYRLAAFQEMPSKIRHPDKELIHDFRHGFSVGGHSKSANIFSGRPPLKPKRLW